MPAATRVPQVRLHCPRASSSTLISRLWESGVQLFCNQEGPIEEGQESQSCTISGVICFCRGQLLLFFSSLLLCSPLASVSTFPFSLCTGQHPGSSNSLPVYSTARMHGDPDEQNHAWGTRGRRTGALCQEGKRENLKASQNGQAPWEALGPLTRVFHAILL